MEITMKSYRILEETDGKNREKAEEIGEKERRA